MPNPSVCQFAWARQVSTHPVILIHNGWFSESAFPICTPVHGHVKNSTSVNIFLYLMRNSTGNNWSDFKSSVLERFGHTCRFYTVTDSSCFVLFINDVDTICAKYTARLIFGNQIRRMLSNIPPFAGGVVVTTSACHAGGTGSIPGTGSCYIKIWLSTLGTVYPSWIGEAR